MCRQVCAAHAPLCFLRSLECIYMYASRMAWEKKDEALWSVVLAEYDAMQLGPRSETIGSLAMKHGVSRAALYYQLRKRASPQDSRSTAQYAQDSGSLREVIVLLEKILKAVERRD